MTVQGLALCFPCTAPAVAHCSGERMGISSSSSLLQDGNYMVCVISLIFFTGRRFCQTVLLAMSVGPDGVGAVQP